MNHYIKTTSLFFFIIAALHAKENVNSTHRLGPIHPTQVLAGCVASKSSVDLDINNVRCPILINGDMWWDFSKALYEVPKGSGLHSLFAGSIWLGGKDGAGNLKVAAQTYRQSGSDFWPGPLDTTNASISAKTCLEYDKHYKITYAEVKNFHEQYQIKGDKSYESTDKVVENWPGNGNVNPPFNQALHLAPFYDKNDDGIYDYRKGDYPKLYLG